MKKEDYESTTKLIDEAYKNMRMASFAIDSIITKIENKDLEDLLRKQNEFYLNTTKKIEKVSSSFKHKPADISIFLKGSSFASIKLKTMMNNYYSQCKLQINNLLLGTPHLYYLFFKQKYKDNMCPRF